MHSIRPRSGLLRDTLLALFRPANGKPDPEGKNTTDDILSHGILGLLPGRAAPSYIPASGFATAVIDSLIPDTKVGAATPPAITDLRNTAAKLPESAAKDALLAIFDLAGKDIVKATRAIEGWYADVMNRVSGIYKRYVQVVLFVTGFILATLLNADTIMIARALVTDPQTRSAVVESALATAEHEPADQSDRDPERPREEVLAAQRALMGSSLPLGWSNDPVDPRAFPWMKPESDPKRSASAWDMAGRSATKLLGLLLTAAAVSFGAPFWFDILNRATNLRLNGPKPKAPDGSSNPQDAR